MKVKVLQFVSALNDGGAETLIKEYVTSLNRERFDAKVVTVFAAEGTATTLSVKNAGIEIITVFEKYGVVQRLLNHIVPEQYITYKFRKIIELEKPQCIHIHMWLLKYFLPLSDFLNRLNVKIFYTCHSLPKRYFGKDNLKEDEAARYLLEHNNLQLIALHQEMAEEINQMFSIENTIVLNNGIDIERFRSIKATKLQVRDSIGIPTDAFVVGHVGRLSEVKNQLFLVDIFSKIYNKNQNAFLLLVGDGGLRKQIEEKLFLLNLTDRSLILEHRSDIPQIMKAMDFFVFPSLFEGLGIVLIEAQIIGLPCVISDKVPLATQISNLVSVKSLSASATEWADSVCTYEQKRVEYFSVDEWDMKNVINRLANIYDNSTGWGIL